MNERERRREKEEVQTVRQVVKLGSSGVIYRFAGEGGRRGGGDRYSWDQLQSVRHAGTK